MTFTRYFTVTGERAVTREDERGRRVEVSRKPSAVRFSTVRQADAEAFASSVFRSEKVLCEIHEHERAPQP